MNALWALPGALAWLAVLALPWRPCSTRERLDADPSLAGSDLGDVTVLIPARDEAACLGRTLECLGAQGEDLRVVVVDDRSRDGTAGVAHGAGLPGLLVIPGAPLPPGWTGKMWALEQGRAELDRPYTLLLDADIALAPGTVATLRDALRDTGACAYSLMARLPVDTLWERVLLPAFVFFFKLLYPFALTASPRSRVAGGAGGCMMLCTRALDAAGAFVALRDAIIDDCSLAGRVKALGLGVRLALTGSAASLRRGHGLGDVWSMVSRTAFTQLEYSLPRLVGCTVAMAACLVIPVAALVAGDAPARALGALALAAAAHAYAPTVAHLGLGRAWTACLPLAGALFLAMTWTSAWGYWRGLRSAWRGRRYRRAAGSEC